LGVPHLQSSSAGPRWRPGSARTTYSGVNAAPVGQAVREVLRLKQRSLSKCQGMPHLVHLHADLVPVMAEPDDYHSVLLLHVVQPGVSSSQHANHAQCMRPQCGCCGCQHLLTKWLGPQQSLHPDVLSQCSGLLQACSADLNFEVCTSTLCRSPVCRCGKR
jgi:hypothetical protein